jgi:hypothetical protein
MTTIPRMMILAVLAAALPACGHDEATAPDATEAAPTATETQAATHLTRHLYVLDQASACAGTLQGFFQCVLGQTNWNDLADTYSQGETIVWGGQKVVPAGTCAEGNWTCAASQGGWALTDFDVLLVVGQNGATGGWNATASINGHTINVGFVGDSGGDCKWQTTYAGHEVFEAQTDGISADCCDGELPFQTAACHAPTQGYGGADAHACAKFAPTGCCDGGVCSSDPWGVRSVTCGGTTYQYQMVSPAGHESDGTCRTLAAPTPTGANGVGVAAGACTAAEVTNARLGTVNYWTCQGNTRYLCDDHGNKIVESCPSGCISEGVGVDDQCNGGGGPSCTQTEITNQTGSGSALPSIWTCQGTKRYVCDGRGFKISEQCPSSCLGEGFNHDDQCQ